MKHMFTGIISTVGTIISRVESGDLAIRIKSDINSDALKIGESIACNGVCLTVTQKSENWFEANVSAETLRVTSAKFWQQGASVNLERSLKVGDDLSGHFVSGHVDGIAVLKNMEAEGDSHRLTFEVEKSLHRFISQKGSVTLNGVSLTVNQVDGQQFSVNIIPHTWKHTNFHLLVDGDGVNIEVDILARYVARILA